MADYPLKTDALDVFRDTMVPEVEAACSAADDFARLFVKLDQEQRVRVMCYLQAGVHICWNCYRDLGSDESFCHCENDK